MASSMKPLVDTLKELKIAFPTWLKDDRPHLLADKVELFLSERGHRVVWTLPYCPKLQPIKLFWAAGKNHVGLHYTVGQQWKRLLDSSGMVGMAMRKGCGCAIDCRSHCRTRNSVKTKIVI